MSTHSSNHFGNQSPSSPSPAPPSSSNDDFEEYYQYIQKIQRIYKSKIQPLEVNYNFEGKHVLDPGCPLKLIPLLLTKDFILRP